MQDIWQNRINRRVTLIHYHCSNMCCALLVIFRISFCFEALTAVTVKITAFWYVTPCSLLELFPYSGGTCGLHIQECQPTWRYVSEYGRIPSCRPQFEWNVENKPSVLLNGLRYFVGPCGMVELRSSPSKDLRIHEIWGYCHWEYQDCGIWCWRRVVCSIGTNALREICRGDYGSNKLLENYTCLPTYTASHPKRL